MITGAGLGGSGHALASVARASVIGWVTTPFLPSLPCVHLPAIVLRSALSLPSKLPFSDVAEKLTASPVTAMLGMLAGPYGWST